MKNEDFKAPEAQNGDAPPRALLVEGAAVFNVYLKKFEEKTVLAEGGVFTDLFDPHDGGAGAWLEERGGSGVERIDAGGLWMVPGLVDIHMHIESSMTTPEEFSRLALPFGTCTVVADPHEIANVFGIRGIRSFMDARTGLDIFYGLPSSVPSTNGALESSGGTIGPDEIRDLARHPRVLCLGEVMNAAELCGRGPSRAKSIVGAFREARPFFPVEGHCPKISGSALSRFIASGVWSDHTLQTPGSILEKAGKGMFLELQKKSLTPQNIRVLVDNGLYEHMALVTDDVMPDQLLKGHLNLLVREAIALGMSAGNAVYCASYTPSRHMLLRDRGAIAPGRIADFILLKDLERFEIAGVYKRGVPVSPENGGSRSGGAGKVRRFPPDFYASIRRRPLEEGAFVPPLPPGFAGDSLELLTMEINGTTTFTRRGRRSVRVRDGRILWEEAGLSLITVIERYGGESPLRFGFVEGAFTERGAAASSWSHDSHNILVMGSDSGDMGLAANRVIEKQGGFAVVKDGRVAACAELPVGGIVSDAPLEELAAAVGGVRKALAELGYRHANEIMSFATLALLVSPELKISDKGLVDTAAQKLVDPYLY